MKSNMALIIRVAKQYYELNLDQEQIANKEHISKSTVSRMIRRAKDLGYVRIEVDFPLDSIVEIEDKFKTLFTIPHVFVCPAYVEDYLVRIKDTCKVVGHDVAAMVEDNDIIGVSWGRTMDAVASQLTPPTPPRRNIKIVQMHGSLIKNIASTKVYSIVEKFSDAFFGSGYLLPAPMFVDSKEIAEIIMRDTSIRSVLDIAVSANIAVFGIGGISSKSILVDRGIYSPEQYDTIPDEGIVGDICSNYYDINGRPVLTQLMERTIGIKMDDLKQKKYRIGVGIGEHKIKAIIGALNSGVMTHLYIDELTARELLRQHGGMTA